MRQQPSQPSPPLNAGQIDLRRIRRRRRSRNLFYDGFRSIFPWTGFLLFGMRLGRQDLSIAQLVCDLYFAESWSR